mgnify:CR=1 FL=1
MKYLSLIYFLILPLFLIGSCDLQKSSFDEDSIEILNLIIQKSDSSCLFKESYYLNERKRPINKINHYIRVYKSSKKSAAYNLFYKDVDGIITIEELDEMKTIYSSWSNKDWQQSDIKKKNIHIVSIYDVSNVCDRFWRISEPLFTRDKKKAIVSVYFGNKSGGTVLKILKKENGVWSVKGGIPIGTSG